MHILFITDPGSTVHISEVLLVVITTRLYIYFAGAIHVSAYVRILILEFCNFATESRVASRCKMPAICNKGNLNIIRHSSCSYHQKCWSAWLILTVYLFVAEYKGNNGIPK